MELGGGSVRRNLPQLAGLPQQITANHAQALAH
jgi:hypothetical protein